MSTRSRPFFFLVLSASCTLFAGLAGFFSFLPKIPSLSLIFLVGIAFVASVWSVSHVIKAEWKKLWRFALSSLIFTTSIVALLGNFWLLIPGILSFLGIFFLLFRAKDLPHKAEANLFGLLFTLPAVFLLIMWHFAPAIYAFFLSLLNKFNFLKPIEFAGAKNYANLLTDEAFWKSLLNSFWYTVGTVPVGIFLATIIAVLLNEKIKGLSFFRTIFFLPYITALTAAAAVWKWIYNPDFGILNAIFHSPGQKWLDNPEGIFALALSPLGIHLPDVFAGPSVALCSIMVMSIWHHLGYAVVILLAGLQSIPREYYEAASLDGATWWQSLRHLTWPLLGPTTFFLSITGLIGAFQVFTQILVLTPTGGVLGDTTTIVKYLYDKGFRDSDFSYASAMAFALFVIVFLATLWQNRVLSKRVTYDL